MILCGRQSLQDHPHHFSAICHFEKKANKKKIINSNYCLINTEISAACSACGPQLDAISKFGQLAWAAVFHLLKTDRHLGDLQAEEGAGIRLEVSHGPLGKEHMVQNHGKKGALCLCLLIKGSPIPEEGMFRQQL